MIYACTEAVPFGLTAKKTLGKGDVLVVDSLVGTHSTLKVDESYLLTGRVCVAALKNATLYVGNTSHASCAIVADPDSSLYVPLPACGDCELPFSVRFTLRSPGTLHVTIYDLDNANPTDNVYAGWILGDVAS